MNAKLEFPGKFGEVLCAYIDYSSSEYDLPDIERVKLNKELYLKKHHTKEEFDQFLNKLDFEYDSGYGSQELHGIIWYTDGTYCDRYEYDGSESWSHHRCPDIPDSLEDKERERDIKIGSIID